MIWHLSWRADQSVRPLADRHYSRKTPGAQQFTPPGRCLVLTTAARDAYWVTSWPYPEYVQHAWPEAWNCSAFRNEGPLLSSVLIREAVAATIWAFRCVNAAGMVTFVDERKVRRKRDPGRCFRRAGFRVLPERTKDENLLVLKLEAADMPEATAPVGAQLLLEAA